MLVPDDVELEAFLGDALLRTTVLERLRGYEMRGDAALKTALLQEKWADRARSGIVVNPYLKIVRREEIAGLRISGDVSTLYALGKLRRNQLFLMAGDPEGRIYGVRYSCEDTFHKELGVPVSLASLLQAISRGLPPERETSWLRQFWAAVPVGASLWHVPMRLVVWALSDPKYGILGLSNTNVQGGKADRGLQAVQDFLALYQSWQAGGRAERPHWFSFVKPAEDDVQSSQRKGDDGQYVYDLLAPVRFCLRAAAHAARGAGVEEDVTAPLPAGTIAIQLSDENLNAPGYAIDQAGLYASHRGIALGVWYEACASVLLDILANCPVPEQSSN